MTRRMTAVKVKPVAEVLDFPPLPAALMEFIDWVAAYTLSKTGEVLALGLKESLLAAPAKRGKKFAFGGADPALAGPDFSEAQAAAVAALRAAVGAQKFGVTLLDGVTGLRQDGSVSGGGGGGAAGGRAGSGAAAGNRAFRAVFAAL